jgi:hypothetical protein
MSAAKRKSPETGTTEPDRSDRDEDRPESSRRPQTNDVALREARQLLDVIGSLDGL